ncbi:MAG: hypothetical protein ACE5KH_04685 [Candidatus Geothermarchaeales archaeon]
MRSEILNTDYTNHVDLLGTAHFTRRSIQDAYEAVDRGTPRDLALELDRRRFSVLNALDASEFIGASDALGNVDANIWLIDMDELDMRRRIGRLMTISERRNLRILPWISAGSLDEPALWELGLKEMVLERNRKRLQQLKEYVPSIWRVLIDERNVLMSGRLAWIATERIQQGMTEPGILALVGAAHVEGIRELLAEPSSIASKLRSYGLEFTPPDAIRRMKVS